MSRWVSCLALILYFSAGRVHAQDLPYPDQLYYTLLEGSTFTEDCPVCDGPTIDHPLQGSFILRRLNQNPLFTTYAVEQIDFFAGPRPPTSFSISGKGTYQFGGEVALQQTMDLELIVNGETVVVTNPVTIVSRPWPMIFISLTESNATAVRAYSLHIAAAPMREVWFTTENGFTPAQPERPRGSAGDLLSNDGRVVRSSQDLTAHLGFMPPTPDLGIDALEMGPGGEVLFSLNESAFSETLGAIQHGDVVSDRGTRLYLNQQLLEEFGLSFDALDFGLDVLSLQEDGEVLFSLTTNVLSAKAGMLHCGDLLSIRGSKVRTYEQLLARFHPSAARDYGLDAVYLWPSGEVWFSTEDGFQDEQLGPIQHGDVLSDQGYIVFRNLELLGRFQPIEDLADFGLDGLFIVSDYIPLRLPPHLAIRGSNNPRLEWTSVGRVFEVERSSHVTGPWVSASPVIPGSSFEVLAEADTFYRLKQW